MSDNNTPFTKTAKKTLYGDTQGILRSDSCNVNSNARLNGNLFYELDDCESLDPGLSIQSNNENHASISSEFSLESPSGSNENDTVVPQICPSYKPGENCDMMEFLNFHNEEQYNNNVAFTLDANSHPTNNVMPIKNELPENKVDDVLKSEIPASDVTNIEYFGFEDMQSAVFNDEANAPFESAELLSSPPKTTTTNNPLLILPSMVIGTRGFENNTLQKQTGLKTMLSEGNNQNPCISQNHIEATNVPEHRYDSNVISPKYLQNRHFCGNEYDNHYHSRYNRGLGIFLPRQLNIEDSEMIRNRKPLLPYGPLHTRLEHEPKVFDRCTSNNNAHEMLSGADTGHKSQSISKMPLAQMYAMMGLSGDHIKAKWREQRIIDIVRSEGFKVGSQTWIRDTDESERFRIINSIMFQCGREFGYDKALIEIIVRRGTYARMQSKLRQERRIKRRVIAANMRNSGDVQQINADDSVSFHQNPLAQLYRTQQLSQQLPQHMQQHT